MDKRSQDIDVLVEKAIRNATAKDLSHKGFLFGKKYHEAGNNPKACEWLLRYIKTNDRDYKAHKILGDCYEEMGKLERAISCYKQSLQIKPQQGELLLKVVEMHINPGAVQNVSKAQVWLDKAIAFLPGNHAVYKLKIELLLAQQASPDVLENTFKLELKRRGNDPSLYVQYVSFLKDQDRLKDAFQFVESVYNSIASIKSIEKDVEWNQCVIETCHEYSEEQCADGITPEGIRVYYTELLFLCKRIWLCLENKNKDDGLEKLEQLDSLLCSAINITGQKDVMDSVPEWYTVLQEIKGQLLWLSGIYIVQLATESKVSWKLGNELSAACFGASLQIPIPELTSCVRSHADVQLPKQLKAFGSMRLSQCYHGIKNMATAGSNGLVSEDDWLQRTTEAVCNAKGQHQIFKLLFEENQEDQSVVASCEEIRQADLYQSLLDDLYTDIDIDVSQEGSLQTWVWLGLQYDLKHTKVDFLPWIGQFFEDLLLSIKNISTGYSSLNLCCLDVEAFLVGCVLNAKEMLKQLNNVSVGGESEALLEGMLPLPLGKALCSRQQIDWWEAACNVYGPKDRRLSYSTRTKAVLRHGIDAVRCSGNHGIQLALLIAWAQHFCAKAHCITTKDGLGTSSSAWQAYQSRAAHYWLQALPLLQDVVQNKTRSLPTPKDRLFSPELQEPKKNEAETMICEVYMCHGALLTQQKKYDEALQMYGKGDTPYASFCQALIYKQLLEECSLEPEAISVDARKLNLKKKLLSFLDITMNRLEYAPDENIFKRANKLMRAHMVSPDAEDSSSSETEKENNTVNSGVSDTSIFPVPSKQSTPKEQTKSFELANTPRQIMLQMSDNIQALTEAVSSLQVKISSDSVNQNQALQADETLKVFSALTQAVEGLNIQLKDGQSNITTPTIPSFPQTPRLPNMSLPPGVAGTPMQMYDRFPPVSAEAYYTPPSFIPRMPMFAQGNISQYATPQAPMHMPRPQQIQPHPITDLRNKINQSQSDYNDADEDYEDDEECDYQFTQFQQQQNAMGAGYASLYPSLSKPTLSQTPLSHPPLSNPSQTLPTFQANAPAPAPILKGLINPNLISQTSSNFNFKPAITDSNQQPPMFGQQTNIAKPEDTPFIKNLLLNQMKASPQESPRSRAYGEIQFPSTFKTFTSGETPKDLSESFQAPEDIDRANQQLDKDEKEDDANKSNTDTGPYFEPVIQLSAVKVETGEENETTLFAERCKLYRYLNEWKERGIGTMKILKNKNTGKIRLLMRREQVFKVCCNHFITGEMVLSSMSASDRAWVWQAMDFYEGESHLEKLAVKFKTPEIANDFKVKFEEASVSNSLLELEKSKEDANKTDSANSDSNKPSFISTQGQSSIISSKPTPMPAFALGSSTFNFSKTMQSAVQTQITTVMSKPDTASKSQDADDPAHLNESADVQFEPIVKLSVVNNAKTGEENEKVLFSHRAKLFRYTDKQWKERGLGDMKILFDPSTNSSRIVMRREQVLKVCANHRLSTKLSLKPMNNLNTSWIWTAMDFAESDEGKMETFAVKFKLVETAKEFKNIFDEACAGKIKIESSDNASSVGTKPASTEPIADKSSVSSWDCPTCMVTNKGSYEECPCCNTRNPTLPATKEPTKSTGSGFGSNAMFTFGAQSTSSSNQLATGSGFGIAKDNSNVSNNNNPKFSFGVSKPPEEPKSTATSKAPGGISFGMASILATGNTSSTTTSQPASNIFGSAAKPAFGSTFGVSPSITFAKENVQKSVPLQTTSISVVDGKIVSHVPSSSWNCPSCMVNNPGSADACPCCGDRNPNAATPGEKEPANKFGSAAILSFGVSSSTQPVVSPQKFQFGIPTKVSPGSVFGASKPPATNIFGQQTASTSPNTQVPKFPSVTDDDYGDETTDDDSEYTTTEDSYSTDEKDDIDESEEKSDGEVENEDVVCLGEILPSEELQHKAASLQLPKHFYNFLGESSSDDNSESTTDTDDEASEGEIKIKPNLAALKTNLITKPLPTDATKDAPLFGQGSTISFSDLASKSGNGFKKTDSWVGLKEGKPLFANAMKKEEECEQHENEERDDIHFEPIAQLTEVEVVSGEENDETLFSERCKLYRYNRPTKEWKERGIGNIKILRNKNNQRIRIIMRREQIHQVCANHYVTSDMELQQSASSNKAWVWTALDFSTVDDPQMEQFTVRFKTEEIANKFKEEFDNCQQMLTECKSADTSKQSDDSNKTLLTKVEKMKTELKFFKDKFGLPSSVKLDSTDTEVSTTVQDVNLSLTPLVEQHERQKKLFAQKQTTETEPFVLKLAFGNEIDKSSEDTTRKPTISLSEDPQAESPHAYFEPVVKLTQQQNIKTGEEEEEVLFRNRAKLFNYHWETKQWKERGLGDVKVLQHKTTFRARILMRRHQVHKVCLNHNLSRKISLRYKEESKNTITWTAKDFSDTEHVDGKFCNFCIRFKLPETAELFLTTINNVLSASDNHRLMEPLGGAVNLSTIQVASPTVSQHKSINEENANETTPVKNPLSVFDFSNKKESFLEKLKSGGGFQFGKPEESKSNQVTPSKFNFDVNKVSFNFGATSTPAEIPKPTFSMQNDPKPAASKLLFSEIVRTKEPIQSSQNAEVSSSVTGPSTLTSESTVGSSTDQDDDVIFVSELQPSADQRKRAEALLLPSAFYLYEEKESVGEVSSEAEDEILDYMTKREANFLAEKSPTASMPTDTAKVQSAPKETTVAPTYGDPSTATSSDQVFGFASAGTLSFKDLISKGASQGFLKDPNAAQITNGSSGVLFGSKSQISDQNQNGDGEFNCTADFKPVVTTKELSEEELKTGEEDEETLFEERCKLYKFDKDTKQWKERGLGNIKILRHKTNNKHRVVMRREQVHKLCANHYITNETTPQPHCGMDTACAYSAIDFSDGDEYAHVSLAMRFKKPEICSKFMEIFDEAKSQ